MTAIALEDKRCRSLAKIRADLEGARKQYRALEFVALDTESALSAAIASLGRVRAAGLELIQCCSLPDGFAPDSLAEIARAQAGIALALTTEDELKARLRPILEPLCREGLSRNARRHAKTTLEAKLAELEEQEELEILRLEDSGFLIARRPDADPALLLRLWA